MSIEENDATVGRLYREHQEAVEQRIRIVERTKQIADALHRLARAIDSKPDFDEVSKDSILQKYLDLSKIASLVLEEQALSVKVEELSQRLKKLGFHAHS